LNAEEEASKTPKFSETKRSIEGILQNPTGWHNGQRVWGGGIIKLKPSEWVPWPIDLDPETTGSTTSRSDQVQPFTISTSFSSATSSNGSSNVPMMMGGNIHTGATPPWLIPDGKPTIGPSLPPPDYLQKLKEKNKKVKNQRKVGGLFHHKPIHLNENWLPNFGSVFQYGSRGESRREFQEKLQKQEKSSKE
jgi:hypothetical protein